MGKNVAVFVDVANIFYAAKAAGVDIDYVTLLKSATAGRDLVRAYAYTGLDPDNENQRNFHDFLRRSNYKVVSKDIRKYGDGKVKANLDIELVVDMMKTARNLDIAIVVSGDGDFAPAIRAVQEQGVRVEVISFRGNTSSDLMDVADQFTDIVQLARVEKGSRSGRRVAEDEGDLSMTEVPDKLTEGTGVGRGRGRGRSRVREEEPVAIAGRSRRVRSTPLAAASAPRGETAGAIVALPGERLARAGGALTESDLAAAEVFTLDDLDAAPGGAAAGAAESPESGASGEGPDELGGELRRRRRRGGRGRGRGRGRAEEGQEGQETQESQHIQEGPEGRQGQESPTESVQSPSSARPRSAPIRPIRDDDQEIAPPRRAPRSTPFGSFWDSQPGTPVAPAAASLAPLAPLTDDEDFDEPEIPEYLIAEQRRGLNRGGAGGGGGGRGGPRGGRSAYQSAMERERYGRGGGGGGINRYPDVSSRTRPSEPQRDERGFGRGDRPSAPPSRSSNEPWSDVPPELEAMLRAQVAQKPTARPVPVRPAPVDALTPSEPAETTVARAPRAARKPAARVPKVEAAVADAGTTAAEAASKRRTTRTPKATPAEALPAATVDVSEAPASRARPARKPATARVTVRKTAATEAMPVVDAGPAAAAPKRRTTRKAASTGPA